MANVVCMYSKISGDGVEGGGGGEPLKCRVMI